VSKLPKQWKHWCADSKLKPHGTRGRDKTKDHSWFYLKGHGRYWRLNCHNEFECGDTYEEFDRWALCTIEYTAMPKTRAEFRAAVKHLLELQAINEHESK
jgi:hypothetical protein